MDSLSMVKTSNGTGSSSGLLSRIESALVNSPVNFDRNFEVGDNLKIEVGS